MPRLFLFALVLALLSGCVVLVGGAAPAPASTFTPTPFSTDTPQPSNTPTPTETPTATAERLPAEDRWQVSPDGYIAFNEAQLYGGLFTIDTEHPEYAEKYWEDSVRGLWNLNSVGKNTAFLSQFPTGDSLVKYLKDGGTTVNNLWIPVIYPNAARRFWYQATLEPIEVPVDLSQIAISIYKPTRDEMYHYSPSYATGTKYISCFGGGEQVFVEKTSINGKNVLQFTFRSDIFFDDTADMIIYGGLRLALTEEKTPEENLLAATQLVRSWPLRMQIRDDVNTGAKAWIDTVDPPILNINSIVPLSQEFEAITTLDGAPLAIR